MSKYICGRLQGTIYALLLPRSKQHGGVGGTEPVGIEGEVGAGKQQKEKQHNEEVI